MCVLDTKLLLKTKIGMFVSASVPKGYTCTAQFVALA